jgi:endonuclease YncB( thermonuclease family)
MRGIDGLGALARSGDCRRIAALTPFVWRDAVEWDEMRWSSGKARAFALALIAAGAAPSVRAADGVCAEAGALFATAEAAGARDGITIRLTDGREVRLAGVIAATDLDGDTDAVRRATLALDQKIAGRRITLHGRAEDKDRYGRLLAQVTIEGEAVGWVQAALVTAGALRVAPTPGVLACAQALLVRERAARAARAGLWASDRFAVESADSIMTLTAATGRFAIIEGTVRRIGESGGRLFLDFGTRYTEDFTVVIPRDARAAFAAAGIDLKALAGMRVRARGVLVSWGGPAVEIRLPAALELVAKDGA